MSETFTLVIGTERYSTWSLRPWLLMKALGLEFKTVRIALRQPDTKAKILEWSPSGKIPLLIHGTRKIWDSLAIAEYLAELFPDRALWPAETEARAFARSIAAEMHSGFQALRSQCPMDLLAHMPLAEIGDDLRTDIDRVEAIWAEARDRFGRAGPYLFGTFTIADAMYAPVVSRFVTYDLATRPSSTQYCQTIIRNPWVEEWIEAARE